MPTFLHVGCGGKRKDRTTRGFNVPEWTEVRFDIDPALRPDILGSILDMAAVADASVDAVYSSHNIEHVYAHEVPRALGEFRRVLKPDGFLVITCPDLQAVCRMVAEDKLTQTIYQSPAGPIAPIDILYGARSQLARGHHYMAHKCGFTLSVLIGTLKDCGFEAVAGGSRGGKHLDLWALACKGATGEDELRRLAKLHFP